MVTLYQYMRLLGYPADKISMLTTYNGQKALLKDVVERRCAHHPAFGVPHKVPLRRHAHGSCLDSCTDDHLSSVTCSSLAPSYAVSTCAVAPCVQCLFCSCKEVRTVLCTHVHAPELGYCPCCMTSSELYQALQLTCCQVHSAGLQYP